MTKKEANEWLKEVTGRKIKTDYWPEGDYVIPTGKWKATSHSDPYYWLFWCFDENGGKGWGFVRNGFEKTSHSDKWELLETFEDYLEMYHKD